MKRFENGADPGLLARLQPAAPAGVTLKGKHPNVSFALKNVPEACGACHARTLFTLFI